MSDKILEMVREVHYNTIGVFTGMRVTLQSTTEEVIETKYFSVSGGIVDDSVLDYRRMLLEEYGLQIYKSRTTREQSFKEAAAHITKHIDSCIYRPGA